MTVKGLAVGLVAGVAVALSGSSKVGAASVRSVEVFAEGASVNANSPDSIELTDHSVWVSYGNGADSTGLSGSSTVVEYSYEGHVRRTFSIAGSVDGLRVDPRTDLVWALQNQDGNSTLTLINRDGDIVPGSPFQYAVKSSIHGYDDVVFDGDRTFMSYTNPVNPSDPTIQLLVEDSNPLRVKPILTLGATGTNLATGQRNEPTTQNDPDSLKLTPWGDLMLTSGDDGQLVFVAHPGRPRQPGQPGQLGQEDQRVSFLTLLDPTTHLHVSGLDDALFVTARRGVFYLSDTGNNRILAIHADDLEFGSLYASVGSLNALVSVRLDSGDLSTFVGNLNSPHGLAFRESDDDRDRDGKRGRR
jgi:hypothetical protein